MADRRAYSGLPAVALGRRRAAGLRFSPCSERAITRPCEGRVSGAIPGRGAILLGPSAKASQPRFERGIVSVQLRPDLPFLRVARAQRRPSSKRDDAGGSPAAETSLGGCREQFPERS